MKKIEKTALFALGSIWVAYVIIDKWSGAAGAVMHRRSAWPVKAGTKGVRVVKSLLLGTLAVMNIFMAISLITSKDR